MSRVAIGAKRPLLPKSALTTPAMSNAGAPEPCQPNGTTAIGAAASWPSVIVMLSCASATAPHHAHAATSETEQRHSAPAAALRSLPTLRL